MLSTFTIPRSWRPALAGALLLAAAGTPRGATAQRVLWSDDAQLPAAARTTTAALSSYRPVAFQLAAVRSVLDQAPAAQGAGARRSTTVMSLPLPDGTSGRFRVVEVAVMHPQLAALFPTIKTYEAQGIDDPSATARLDVTPAGFHAMILIGSRTVFIDPAAAGDVTHHLVFEKRSMSPGTLGAVCLNTDVVGTTPGLPTTQARIPNGTTLRTYRLAIACTGEYAATKGGTVTGAMAGITTSVNRVSGVYEKELAVRLVIVPGNQNLIFTDRNTDPYTNNDGPTMLDENQSTVDRIIGSANYDIGHVFSTGGGGIAQKPSVCLGGKARGVTGLPNPVGDAFDIDFVAHEMGHQFGADHTFNSGTAGNCTNPGTRAAASSYEPGSGSTIMGYAGTCRPEDTQPNSDPYFHSRSFDQIVAHINGAGNCSVNTPTNNNVPVVNAGPNYRIPIGTPFALTGSATDADNDPLTYSWEQYNLGPAGSPNSPEGDAPIFRVFSPVPSPTRTFPQLSDLLNNRQTLGEILPSYGRRLIFRLVARDNRVGGGGVDYDSMNVAVIPTAGPFLVNYPDASTVSWLAGAPQRVAWNVASTDRAPINAANVDILLSMDGGQTYPIVLASATPNDGNESVTVPVSAGNSSRARLKIQATGNVFFDISNNNFTIQAPNGPTFFLDPQYVRGTTPALCPGTSTGIDLNVGAIQGFTGPVTLSAANLPTGFTVSYANPTVNTGSNTLVTLTAGLNTPSGTYTIDLVGTSGSQTQTQQLQVTVKGLATIAPFQISPVGAGRRVGSRPGFTWAPVPNATSYEVQVSTSSTFATSVLLESGIIGTTYYPSLALAANTTYYWRVRATSECGTTPFSAGAEFLTGTETCQTLAATQVPRILFAGATPTVTSVIPVTSSELVTQIRVRNLTITHPDVSELRIILTSPTGRTATLFSRNCPGNTDMTLTFDDQATTPITCPLTAGGTVRPVTPLSALLGEPANGNWTLSVTDNVIANGGRLTAWTLELCAVADAPNAPATLVAFNSGFSGGSSTNTLVWTTPSPNNAEGFEIERSFGSATNFQFLTRVASAGATSYDDNVTTSGSYFYRVRAYNSVGTSAFTNTANVLGTRNEALLRGIEVFPNPSTGIFQVNVDNSQRGAITLRVTDALGRTVATETLNKTASPLQHRLDLSKLSKGVYQLHIDMPSGSAVTRLLKQ
ncbi:M12 family metallo-peptidase [Hymenobacter sp. BT175]|uniref:reprolysin-like metallopeptidase n=1 Tax=Hymenobacter translucens TaxID=2886507 RepID=UPI001D0DF060|nr:zinc-dependent metalloprotease family protein [Hymenobacter translucens]MCC2547960.1 M12 family metallo-peptidase [Hymenobacter translucens]